MFAPPKIPWQLTGNHWLALPCIHPADGSIHAVSTIQRRVRGAVEFAGGAGFEAGDAEPLLRIGLTVDGVAHELAALPLAWQRLVEWIPMFTTHLLDGALTVRGTIFTPTGRNGLGMPGAVYALAFENRSDRTLTIEVAPSGTLGCRQYRVCTPQGLDDPHQAVALGDRVLLSGKSAEGTMALAIGFDGLAPALCTVRNEESGAVVWSGTQTFEVAPATERTTALYLAVAPEADGAQAMLGSLIRRGWGDLLETTHLALQGLRQTTGVVAVDRLVTRHLIFAYFYAMGRALDDAQLYLVRTRVPWNSHGHTVREWEALMWTIPAIQLADAPLARELIVRMCEIHGYAPGASVNYLDGMPFRSEFSLEGAASYALAIDRYISQSGDDRVVEEPAVADTLYASHEDISARRAPNAPLYASEAGGAREGVLPYTLHGNAAVAHALDIFRQTLDEKTADKVEVGDLVRAAIKRHLASEGAPGVLSLATDLAGRTSSIDDPMGSAYWVPLYDFLPRSDSTYRRTVKQMTTDPQALSTICASLLGPDASAVLDRLRRLPLDNGMAAERVDEEGNALGNGGDAALSGLLAYTVWYAVTALGVRL